VKDKVSELPLAEMTRGLGEDLFGHRDALVRKPRPGLGESQGGALGIGKQSSLAPGRNREDALVAFALPLQIGGVHEDADAAAVDLRGAQMDQLEEGVREAALARNLVQYQQRG